MFTHTSLYRGYSSALSMFATFTFKNTSATVINTESLKEVWFGRQGIGKEDVRTRIIRNYIS